MRRSIAPVGCLLALCAGASALEVAQIDIHGFVSQGYLRSDDNDYLGKSSEGSFNFGEAALNFGTDLTDDVRIGVQLFARNFSDTQSNSRIYLDWAYADYKAHEMLGVRVGRIKLPRGFYNEIQDIDLARASVLLPQSVYDTRFRDIYSTVDGAGLYGSIPLNAAGSLDYQLFGGTVTPIVDGTTAEYFRFDEAYRTTSFTVDRIFGAQAIWNAPFGIRLGGSVSRIHSAEVRLRSDEPGNPFTSHAHIHVGETLNWVGSIDWTWRDLVLTAEYARSKLSGVVDMEAFPPAFDPTFVQDSEGYYLQAAYRLLPKLEVGAYYSMYYTNAQEHSWADRESYQQDIAVSARYDFSPNWLVKGEVHVMDGIGLLQGLDQPGAEEDWMLYVIKTTVSF